MAEMKDVEDEGFKVVDRRKFTATGEQRSDLPPEEPPAAVNAAARPPEPKAPEKGAIRKPAPPQAVPQESPSGAESSEEFAALIMSLANTAMVYLETRDPIAGSQQNVGAAKQMIEWLEALQRKTEGNRSADENRLLDGLLYELRMQFLAHSKPPKPPKP
jgi:hypothetical protein